MYHYVYKINNKKTKQYYIGGRSSKVKPEEDLGHEYFSSSCNKRFINEQKENPEQFVYEIIKTFSNRKEAFEYETELILQNKNDEKCFNGRIRLEFEDVSSRATKNTLLYLANLIKIARKERGITQEELAERIGVSRMKVNRIESGNSQVAIGSVFEACFVLGIPLMGCDKEHINNLSKMLSYINKFLPENIPSRDVNFNDDF